MLDGVSDAVGPVGTMRVVSEIALLKPPLGVAVIVDVPELPAWIDSEPGVAYSAKFGEPGTVTVTYTPAVCVINPLLPVTVTMYSPAAVAVRESVEAFDVPDVSVREVGLSDAVSPEALPVYATTL